jgi:flagellar hook protein FlgE
MPTILAAAASGLVHNQDILDTVAHNLANANTSGFKAFRALHQGRPDPQATPEGGRLGVATTTRDLLFQPAALLASDSPLHLALQDDALFIVRGPNGEPLYTRYGGFRLDGSGTLVDFAGRAVPGADGEPLRLPEGFSSPTFDASGVLTAIDENGERHELGQIALARFANPQGLEILGDGLFRPTANSGEPQVGAPGTEGFAPLQAGTLEASNVDIAQEFVNMLLAQRAYSASAKTFSIGDAMLELATRINR